MYDVQQTLKSENRERINRKDIAHALHSRNLLRQTKVIQISSNLKYISIQFHTSMLIETFCTNPLTVKNFSLTFKPDVSKRPTRYNEPETISLLNVPSEADEDSMTQFVQQYAVVIGKPRYPVETINDIKYLTGARIYRVHSRREHIPRIVKLFGRQIQCIYTQQPEQQEWLQRKKREQERQNNNFLNSDGDTESQQQNSHTDTETDNESDHQNTDSDIEETQHNEKHIEKQHNLENNIDKQNQRKPTKITITPESVIEYTSEIEDNSDKQNDTTNKKRQVNQHLFNNQNITQRKTRPQQTQNKKNKNLYWIDKLPPDVTEDNYPTLNNNNKQKQPPPSKPNTQTSQDITIIEETPVSQQPTNEENEIGFLSPPIISKPYQLSTPDPIDTLTPTANQNQKKQTYNTEILMPQLYKKGKIIKQETIHDAALKLTRKLAKLNYRDTGFFSNATEEERKRIIALSTCYQLEKFDPSNQFIRTYRDRTIINLVKQYTIEKLHKMNALTNIYLYTHAIEQRMEQDKINKDKDKDKHKNNKK